MIGFWITTNLDFTSGLNQLMGGAESSALNLAKFLSHYWNICVFCDTSRRYRQDGLEIVPRRDLIGSDLLTLFVIRAHEILDPRLQRWYMLEPQRRLILISGDTAGQPNNQKFLTDKTVTDNIDDIIVKSDWQLQEFHTAFPELNNIRFIKFGIKEELFYDLSTNKDENKFICASTIYRGVDQFLSIWSRIKMEKPSAHLHIYASTSLYARKNPRDLKYKRLFEQLDLMPDVYLHVPVNRRALIEEIATSKLMLYPNAWEETRCSVIQESILAGTPVVTSARGALPETVGDNGLLVGAKPYTPGYIDSFTEKVKALCEDSDRYIAMVESGKRRIKHENWNECGKEFYKLLTEEL